VKSETSTYIQDLYTELVDIVSNGNIPFVRKYEGYYRLLVGALNFYTRDLTLEFSGPFARLDHICRQCHYKELHPKGYAAILALRGRCTHLRHYSEEELKQQGGNDLKALCEFLVVLSGEPLPLALSLEIPSEYDFEERKEHLNRVMRVAVENTDETAIYVVDEQGIVWQLPWQYMIFQRQVDLSYMRRWLHPSTQLNLVLPARQTSEGNSHLVIAEQVIYEPDYLIDTSAIAGCVRPYGMSPYEQLIKRFSPFQQTSAILLGNFAGQMLDEEIRGEGNGSWLMGNGAEVSYEESKERFVRQNVLQILTCADLKSKEDWEKFDANARQQQLNIRKMVRHTFKEDKTIDLEKAVLEPSFYCETLGVQGRLDLMQLDKHVLMEQKSGKRQENPTRHREEHYVQMLIYQAMLHYAYTDGNGLRMRNDDIASYLLYSKYPDGLMKESPAPLLLADALKLRNQLAFLDLYLSLEKQGRGMLEALTPEHLNTKQSRGTLWEVYCRPKIAEVLDTLHNASPIEKDYFYRMLRFVAREQVLGKMGNSRKEASGFAALWNCTPAEKKEAGNLLDGLSITAISEAMDELTLQIYADETEILPNFREGDIVVLYAYPRNEEPDARRDMLLRAQVKHLRPDHLVLKLNAPQHNKGVYQLNNPDILWAVEHDHMESTITGLYRGLFAFLQAPKSRRELLLGQRRPERNTSRTLRKDYGGFNDLVIKTKQADDFFLLIGPPGTGKTSCGLVNILNEHLAEGAAVLMVSYTNRAVEEICSKLRKEGIDYLHLHHTDEEMSSDKLTSKLLHTQVIVGTTTTLTNNTPLFSLRHFDLCIIDEASQILEPHLLALLSAKGTDGKEAIGKFVMIGDHKQLPAVVQQSEEESAVEEPLLREIGLQNCRQSLFERLLRGLDPAFYHTLSAQGRMHHEVADFANRHFYGSLLTEVPLDHQLRPIPYQTQHTEDALLQMLTQRRVTFLPVKKLRGEETSDKTNAQEAEQIAAIVEAVYRLYAENQLPFDPDQSVGVIVPYRHQISTIRKYLQCYGIEALMAISIDTVERYQGSQRDVIIYGFTVSKPYQLDFLTNNVFTDSEGQVIDRKLNVALTRARESLVIVGNEKLLSRNEIFRELTTYKTEI